jgi:hypothetical protein
MHAYVGDVGQPPGRGIVERLSHKLTAAYNGI